MRDDGRGKKLACEAVNEGVGKLVALKQALVA